MSSSTGRQVGPGHVGRRVVLRHRLPDAEGLTDVLGDLLSWPDEETGSAVVRTRRGDVEVPVASVVLSKEVPPPPARKGPAHLALDVPGLESVMADGWRPLESAWLGGVEGGWLLRASAGFTGRGNSALPLGDPGTSVAQAVDAVERWYAERGLPARVSVPWSLDDPVLPDRARDLPLDAELRRRGYALDTPTLVLVAPLAALSTARRLPAGLSFQLDDEPDDAWLGRYRYRGQDLPPVARPLLLSSERQAFASVRDSRGDAVAVGRVAVSRGWAGVTAMDVAEEHRRQGLGRVVLAALAGWGARRGAHSAYLQVAEANTGAQALYAAAGFEPHHGYQYRVR